MPAKNFKQMWTEEVHFLQGKVEKYKASQDPYFLKKLPALEKDLERAREKLNKLIMEEADAGYQKKAQRDASKKGAALITQLRKVANNLPREGAATGRGAAVQRIGMLRLAYYNNKMGGYADLTMALVASGNQNPQRLGYLNVRLLVDGRVVPLKARFSLADICAFADGVCRFGPLTSFPGSKYKVLNREIWDKHGNHKLKWQRPYTDKFEKQKARRDEGA